MRYYSDGSYDSDSSVKLTTSKVHSDGYVYNHFSNGLLVKTDTYVGSNDEKNIYWQAISNTAINHTVTNTLSEEGGNAVEHVLNKLIKNTAGKEMKAMTIMVGKSSHNVFVESGALAYSLNENRITFEGYPELEKKANQIDYSTSIFSVGVPVLGGLLGSYNGKTVEGASVGAGIAFFVNTGAEIFKLNLIEKMKMERLKKEKNDK